MGREDRCGSQRKREKTEQSIPRRERYDGGEKDSAFRQMPDLQGCSKPTEILQDQTNCSGTGSGVSSATVT